MVIKLGKLSRTLGTNYQYSIVIAKQNGSFTGQYFNRHKDNNGVSINHDGIIKIMSELKNQAIKSISFSGESTTFTIGNLKMTLDNREDFKDDTNFKFIMEQIKEKRYKIEKRRKILRPILKVGFALTLASVIYTGVKGIDKNVNENTPVAPQVTYVDEDAAKEVKEEPNTVAAPVTENKTTTKKETTLTETKVPVKVTPKKIEKNSPSYKLALTKSLLNVCGSLKDTDKVNYVRKTYGNVIQKYCNAYQVDPEIIISIAAQERGVHASRMDAGGAVGLMQIEPSPAYTAKINVYNHETNKMELVSGKNYGKYKYFIAALGDLENNVKFGCAIFKYHMNRYNNNVLLALQAYNMGEYSVDKILKRYSNVSGRSITEIKNDPTDLGWLNYTNGYAGDPNYVKHVLRYYGNSPLELNISTNQNEVSQGKSR